MNKKKEEFLQLVDFLMENCAVEYEVGAGAAEFYSALRVDAETSDKPQFTENGKLILKAMQKSSAEMLKAKDIAEELSIATRSVSGGLRKLVNDGYVEKIGKDPIVYKITNKGKEINFNEEGELSE